MDKELAEDVEAIRGLAALPDQGNMTRMQADEVKYAEARVKQALLALNGAVDTRGLYITLGGNEATLKDKFRELAYGVDRSSCFLPEASEVTLYDNLSLILNALRAYAVLKAIRARIYHGE